MTRYDYIFSAFQSGNIQPFGELFLGKAVLFSQLLDSVCDCHNQ